MLLADCLCPAFHVCLVCPTLCPNEDGCYRCLPVLGEIRFRVSGVSQHMYYPVCGSVLKGRVRECENLPCLSGACSRSYPPPLRVQKRKFVR